MTASYMDVIYMLNGATVLFTQMIVTQLVTLSGSILNISVNIFEKAIGPSILHTLSLWAVKPNKKKKHLYCFI